MGGEADELTGGAAAAAATPAAAAAAMASSSLALHLEAEFAAYLRAGDANANVVCHIVAPPEPVGAGDVPTRPPLDLITVIDVSGSMAGTKLELVKKTLEFIIRNLRSEDRLGIVTFDSNVAIPLALSPMKEANKSKAQSAVRDLASGTCTNLSGGLFEGMEMMQDATPSSPTVVRTIMLLTDGIANEGVKEERALVEATRGLMAASPAPYSIYTFGYGTDHQATLLKSVAEVGRGMYYFIESDEAVPASFGDCLGGLLTTVAQNLKLTLKPVDGKCTIGEVWTSLAFDLAADGSVASVSLGDIQAEESRDIVLRLALPAAAASAEPLPHLEAKLSYVNVISGTYTETVATLVLQRPESLPAAGQPASELVREQMSRLQITRAVKEALASAAGGDYLQARAALKMVDDTCAHVDLPSVQAMRRDLQECLTTLETEETFKSKGVYSMSSVCQMHSAQRSNRVFADELEAEGRTSYVTKSKKAWRGFSKE